MTRVTTIHQQVNVSHASLPMTLHFDVRGMRGGERGWCIESVHLTGLLCDASDVLITLHDGIAKGGLTGWWRWFDNWVRDDQHPLRWSNFAAALEAQEADDDRTGRIQRIG